MPATKQVKKSKTKVKELVAVVSNTSFFELDWQYVKEDKENDTKKYQDELYNNFSDENIDETLILLGLGKDYDDLSDSLIFIKSICKMFFEKLSRQQNIEELREKIEIELLRDERNRLLSNIPYLSGMELINIEWIEGLWLRIDKAYKNKIENYDKKVEDLFKEYGFNKVVVGRVFFHLVENKKDEDPFAFLATYSPKGSNDSKKHIQLKKAITEYKDDKKKLLELLSTVYRASSKSQFIKELVDLKEIFYPLKFNAKEAHTFLKEIPLYEESGIICRVPNWWQNKNRSLRMEVTVGENGKSYIGTDSIADFNVDLLIGDKNITEKELKEIVSEIDGLAMIKGNWIEVDNEKLKQMLKAYDKAKYLMEKKELTLLEALKFQISTNKSLKVEEEMLEIEVKNGEWLNSVLDKLRNPEKLENIDLKENFKAVLRHYQQDGLNWLYYMKKMGFGACLADDMGLGKTIQIISLLNTVNEDEKNLLIVPASLISNWINEFEKFAPHLRYCILHSTEASNLKEDYNKLLKDYGIFITTYTMATKIKWLEEFNWNNIILDEAQAIKNPGTKQTRTIKKMNADFRVAMTGTPIENRLSDLWSLFDFINKGLLGTSNEFVKFTKRLKSNNIGYDKLKNIVNPFILRRLKTDKKIISDLPDKIEMKTYASLSKRQIALYNELVSELKIRLKQDVMDTERKGIVLSSIIKFKQICNHPDQFLGGGDYKEIHSGKFERLREICEIISEKRERVLIFTQFKEIIEPMKEFLETIFNKEGLILHGSTSVKKRKDIVEKFQSDFYVPFLILSIKAGGVGLNLTNANHVVHFDRWWNPAVENQATDRAFRIGQNKNVIVHKFITKGSIEEKIDLMIEDKIKLSNDIIPDEKEIWIGDIDNESLFNLFKLE
jgi:non-specific serine/threonine protein kinase